MAQSLSKVYIHIVFSTKFRNKTILPDIKSELYKVIAGKIRSMKGIALNINGTPDHIHILTFFPRTVSLADFIKNIKTSSTKWFRNKDYNYRNFSWQNGYAAFSVGEKDLEVVKAYIDNQMQHHATVEFKEELIKLLLEHEVEYNEEYLWE